MYDPHVGMRATPSHGLLERTHSQPNIREKFFISKSDIGKSLGIKPSTATSQHTSTNTKDNANNKTGASTNQSAYCHLCHKPITGCVCIKTTTRINDNGANNNNRPVLTRTQSVVNTRSMMQPLHPSVPLPQRRVSSVYTQPHVSQAQQQRQESIIETQRILEAQQLAMSNKPLRVEPIHQQVQQVQRPDANRRDSSISYRSQPQENGNRNERRVDGRRESSNRRGSSVYERERNKSEYEKRRESRTSVENGSTAETKRETIVITTKTYEPEEDENDVVPPLHPINDIKHVYVQKSSAVDKFLEKNASLKSNHVHNHTHTPTHTHTYTNSTHHDSDSDNNHKQINVNVTKNELDKRYSSLLNNERYLRYSVAIQDIQDEVKTITKNKYTKLFTNEVPIDYSNTGKKVLPVSAIWDELLTYYFATFRGDEKMLEKKLKQELADYDYAPSHKHIRKDRYVRYMKRSMACPNLEEGGFVEKCTTNSIHLYNSGKKWKIGRNSNFIFVYRFNDKQPEEYQGEYSRFRVMLEKLKA